MKQFNFFRFFFRNSKRNWIKIGEVLDTKYSALCDYAEALVQDMVEARKVVRNACMEAFMEENEFEDEETILRYLFHKIDSGIATYHTQRQQLEKASELLFKSDEDKENTKENQKITLEVLRAFKEELEKLPRQRRLILSLFFCGLSSNEVAETIGREKQTVLNQKNNAIKDIREALINRGYLSMGG